MKLLSFCIPTYNRGDTIQATLESICRQYDNSLEIVIYDSGNDEKTQQVVNKYKALYPDIKYVRTGKRAGIDKDIENTISLASGKYSWLLSSDDAIVPGAMRLLHTELKESRDVYLCNRIVCDHNLEPIKNKRWLQDKSPTLYDFKKREDVHSYLIHAKEMGATFSYMSSIIINNAVWRAALDNEKFHGTCYAHISKIFSILLAGGLLKYIEKPLVLNRSFNDSFLQGGILNRYLIDFRGIIQISKHIFPYDRELQNRMVNLMILEHPRYQLAKIKSNTDNQETWKEIRNGLKEYGYDERILRFIEKVGKYRKIINEGVKIKAVINRNILRRYIYKLTQGGPDIK